MKGHRHEPIGSGKGPILTAFAPGVGAGGQETSRSAVVKLQAGDPDCLRAWKLLCEASRVEFESIYKMLDIRLEERGTFLPSYFCMQACVHTHTHTDRHVEEWGVHPNVDPTAPPHPPPISRTPPLLKTFFLPMGMPPLLPRCIPTHSESPPVPASLLPPPFSP